MPEAQATTFDLENKSPPELETRRRDIVSTMQRDYKGYSDPDVPIELLQELAVVTSMLRRKNAGPPKATKAPRSNGKGAKSSVDDLLV